MRSASHTNHNVSAPRLPRAVAPIQPHQLTCSPKQAADAAGVAASTVWLWIRAGRLHTRKVGGRRLVVVASLRSLLGAEEG